MKITKQEFDLLKSEDITVKQHNEILTKINKRFFEICNTIYKPIHGYNEAYLHYESFTCDKYNGCLTNETIFDPINFAEYIPVCGETYPISGLLKYSHKFPTRWLWEDFEEEINEQISKEKERKRKLQEKIKTKTLLKKEQLENINKLKKQIKEKLTQEELKIVTFKKY